MSGNTQITSERKDVNPSVYISSDGKVYVDRFDRTGGKVYNNSGNSVYDSANYSFDKTGSLSISLPVTGGTVSTGNGSGGEVVVPGNGSGGEEESPWLKYLKEFGNSSSTVTGGGMSYGDYLKTYGTDTEKAYSESVRQANSDYYRALMTYGKNAEALGGAGLVGAGVSDYGNAAAYAARQGAVATAGAAKMETDAKQAASYAEYLQNLKAQQEAQAKQDAADRTNYMLTLMSTGVDRATAIGMLNQSGMFTDETQYNAALNVLNSHYDNVDKKTAETTQTVTDATQTEANTRYNELTASGIAPDAAEIQVNQEYGDGFGTNARENAKEITQAHDNAAVNTMLTGNYSPLKENAYTVDYFKKQVEAGAITEEEAEVQIEKIENANLDWAIRKLSDANNLYKVDGLLQELKLTGEFEGDEEKILTAVDAINGKVESLVFSGELSDEKAAEYYATYFDMNFDPKANIEEALMTLSEFRSLTGYLENGDQIYQDALQKVTACVKMDTLVNTKYEHAVAYVGSNMFVKMNFIQASKLDVEGQVKIGAFEKGGRRFTVYANGCFSVAGASSETRYYKGVSPTAMGNQMVQHRVEKNLSPIVQQVFEQWLKEQCGIVWDKEAEMR